MDSEIAPLSSMAYRLRDGVFAVAIDDDVIFLDEAKDRYASLPGGVAFIEGLPSRCFAILDEQVRRDLNDAGLVRPNDGVAPAGVTGEDVRRQLPPPLRSLEPLVFGKITSRDVVEAGRAASGVLLHYFRRPLPDLFARAADRVGLSKALTPEVLAAVHAFHRWLPYAPVPSKCLARSFILLEVLRRLGFTADWVIAVRTWPFAAHCWLQIDDVVLDDHPERLVAFHPIRIV